MESKKDLSFLIEKIKLATGLNQDGIARRIKYKRETLSRAKKKNDLEIYALLEEEFKAELGPGPVAPQNTEMTKEDRALLKALLLEVVALKSEREGSSLEEAEAEIKRNTSLIRKGMD
ncbi:hypothetical protein [Chitinophaga sp. LS1]|uniref:hypothetical protein n=1 Tax=Chitinophaga sp. LS1 TaxID=3051176 RepID=UPI002AAAAB0D|nr:hypothetical protein [Chitinophaga sp. LS1]WPV66324.1 hypothetical protein QQL36_31495 [Chitinophaga sp. LS1]